MLINSPAGHIVLHASLLLAPRGYDTMEYIICGNHLHVCSIKQCLAQSCNDYSYYVKREVK